MMAVGVSSKDFIIVILFALVLYFLLASGGANTPANVPQPTSTSTCPETGPVSVNIKNTDPKIETAVVHIMGTDCVYSFGHGVLSLPVCSTGQNISVWAPGYYLQTQPCDGTKLSYDVTLAQVDETDNANYFWTGAGFASNTQSSCGSCHQGSSQLNEYPEWLKDGHSRAFTHPYFWTTYLGIDTNWRQSQQIKWEILDDGQKIYPILDPTLPNYGPGYQLDYPVSNGNCAFCHVPAALPGTRQEMDLSMLIFGSQGHRVDAITEGVTCDVCHKVTDVLVGKNQLPYDDRPGVLSMSILRPPSAPQFNSGPLAYQSIPDQNFLSTNPNALNAKRTCYPVFSESKFCAPCHYGRFANTLIYGSYLEWLQGPYSKPESYRSCQDCHMLDEAQIGTTLRTERDACSGTNVNFSNFNHNMMKYGPDPENNSREIPLLVQKAAQVGLELKLEGGQIKVKVTVQNTGAGHKFPTDSPLRHLILLVEARDWRDTPLLQTGGPRVPVWAASDYAGYAGEVYANILKDKDTNLAPSFSYWNPVENAWQGSDSRLLPWVPVQNEYSFAAPYDRSATITARLIYRKAFMNVVSQKAWQLGDLDVKAADAGLECTGFGTVPETLVCEPFDPSPDH